MVAEGSYNLPTSGLWAQHASTEKYRKYRNFLNIKVTEVPVTDVEQPKCIDWQHDVTDWEELCEQNPEVLVLFERFDDEAVRAAQKQELDNWKSNDVYQEVPDIGQHALSVCWVITEKNSS